jgi:hypothetical protein
VPSNQKLTHPFRLANGSPTAIEIVKLKSSCGCTTADDLKGHIISPDEVAEIPVTLTSGIRDGEGIYGDITVYYKPVGGGEPAFVVLEVAALVRTDFDLTPRLLDFGGVPAGQSKTQLLTLKPLRMPEIRFTSVEIADQNYQAELLPSGRELRVRYAPQPAARAGPGDTLMYVHTNSPRIPLVYVPLKARRDVPAEVSPSAVVIDGSTHGIVHREVSIVSERAFEVVSVESNDPRVAAKASSTGLNRTQAIAIVLQEPAGTSVNATIQLALRLGQGTANAEAYRVSLPIHRLRRPEQ